MKLYLALTADKYEHIIDFDTNPKVLAGRLGISLNYLYIQVSRGFSGKRSGYKIEKIEIEEGEE